MTEIVKEFSNVSEAKSWVSDRICKLKIQLDDRQSSIFKSLETIGSQIETSNERSLEELEKLRSYKEQTISLFGPTAANIAVIDEKIKEISDRTEGLGKTRKDKYVPSCIKLSWSEAQLSQLVSSIGCVKWEHDTSEEKEPICPPIKNKPKLKASLSSDDTTPVLPPKGKYSNSPEQKLSLDPHPVPSRPFEVSKEEELKFEVESDYVVGNLYSPAEEMGTASLENVYAEMSADDGGNYYIMHSIDTEPCSPPPLTSDGVQTVPMVPPDIDQLSQLPQYEDINKFDDEVVPKQKPLTFPKYPLVARCPEGGGVGCIMKPKSLCVNPANDNLYVVEKGNSRVQIFTTSGDHIKFFADKSGSNKMSGPYGICIANNHVYVTQSTLNCVYVYTPNGSYSKRFGREGSKEGRFSLPSSLTALPAKKQILICDTGNNRIQIFDFAHNFSRLLGSGQLLKPVDISCDASSKIVVLDRGPKCVHVFGHSGDLLYNTVSFSLHKQLSNPLFMTLSPEGDIFLSDYSRNCVFVFSMDGIMKGQIGAEGVLVEPRGLVFDTSGRLVVLSCNHSGCLQFFNV